MGWTVTFRQLNWAQNLYILQNLLLFSSEAISIYLVQSEFANIAGWYKMAFPAGKNCIFLLHGFPVKETGIISGLDKKSLWKLLPGDYLMIKNLSIKFFNLVENIKNLSRHRTTWKLKELPFTANPEFLWYRYVPIRLFLLYLIERFPGFWR